MAVDDLSVSLNFVIASGCATVVLASALAFVIWQQQPGKRNGLAESDVTASKKKADVDKNEYPGGLITVYFATQTGTSESFARQLEREGPEHGFYLQVADLDEMQVKDLVDEDNKDDQSGTAKAIFLCATYGEGDAPDNATVFVESLKEKAATEILFDKQTTGTILSEPESCLVGLDYCVFGLGNKQYDHYNAMGKFFDHAIERLGGNRMSKLGLGDDDADLEADFESWKDSVMWPTIESMYIKDQTAFQKRRANTVTEQKLPDCQYAVEYVENDTKPDDVPIGMVHGSSKHYFTAVDCPVTLVRQLRTPDDEGSTVHVEIDISGSADKICYQTADNLGVLPLNSNDVVESVAQGLGYNLNDVFRLMAAPAHEWHGAPFPMPISIRECLTRYCDLTQAPRRSDLKLLASYAKDPIDQKALLRMSSKEGRKEYKEKILENYIGFVDLLKLCPSIEMPLEHFLGYCSPLQTRFFTISSSSSVYPQSIHLTVAVSMTERKDGTMFEGVCSNYLAKLNPGVDSVQVYVRPSTFCLPSDSTRPIIMVGPGTGVAPMRALIQEREYQSKSTTVGENILYFGCKNRRQDYLYQDEFESYKKNGVLSELHLAFSRERDEKVYVQHLLLENEARVWCLLNDKGAHIYVCGGVRMGHDVAEAIKTIIVSQGKLPLDDASVYMEKLTKDGRYVQELWA